MKLQRTLGAVAVAAALGALPLLAAAQSGGSSTRGMAASTADSYSFLPGTTRGYIGANVADAKFKLPCNAGFSCDDPDVAFKVYTGGAWSEMIGVELGYLYFGEAARGGGDVKAQGVNLSLVGNLPLTEMFNVFAKVGTTYSWTEASAQVGSAAFTGDERGFGLSYGAGLGVDLTRNWTVLAEWEQHRVKFVGGRDDVQLVSLGVKYRF